MSFKPPSPPYVGPPYRSSPGSNKPVTRIVLHGTVSPTKRGGARDIAAYFRAKTAGGSAHYVVDPGEVVQACFDSVVAWHAPPNPGSIGVELCDPVGGPNGPLPMSRWEDADHRAMLGLAARLVAELCLAYDVPLRFVGPAQLRSGLRGICEHSDVSQAWGQSSHWDLGNFPRAHFLKLVRAEAAVLRAPIKTPPPEPAPKPTRVTKARDLLTVALRNSKPSRRAAIKKGLEALPHR